MDALSTGTNIPSSSQELVPKKSFSSAQYATIQKRRARESKNLVMHKRMSQTFFEQIQLKTIVKQLKQKGGLQRNKFFSLIQVCQNFLKFQPNVLHVASPVYIVGDIHGQFFDLVNIFEMNGYPDNTKYLFLGDYVDRGLFCIEVITLLLVLKIKYPQNILLLRGNHQGRVMTMNFNFRLQCQKKYGIQAYERILLMFCKLPLCALVDQTYFAVHGGISPEFVKIKQLQRVDRFVEISNHGVVCDLVWSDPAQDLNLYNWEPNKMRGCSYFYGVNQTKKFLKQNKIKLIIRGHEVQIDGFNYQKAQNDQKLTLTIFSAPNYCDVYKNKGAIAMIRDNKLSIQKFIEVPHPFVLSNYMDCLELSMPAVCQLVGKMFIELLKKRRSSKKDQILDQNLNEQLEALRRIQQINQMMGRKLIDNEFILLENAQKQAQEKKTAQNLKRSFSVALDAFMKKKSDDHEEMYPDEKVMTTIRQRKNTKKMTLIMSKSLSNKMMKFPDQQQEVFGPKLSMRKTICKKKEYLQETECFEDF